MKILVGYDGTDSSRGAIDDLRRAGLFDDTQAIVLSAAQSHGKSERARIDPSDSAGAAAAVREAHERGTHAVQQARAMAEEGAARLRSAFAGWQVSAEASAEPAHRALIARSESFDADLIVLGSHGRGAVARWLLGSVSLQVLHGAHCSVRIGRAPAAPRDAAIRVLVGVDGSSDAALAVSAVAARQWPGGTEIRIISVLDVRVSAALTGMDPLTGAWVNQPAVPMPSEATLDEAALKRIEREIERPGIAVSSTLIVGDPKHVLVEEADAMQADCIVVGGKGHSRLERMLLGSVSSYVAMHAHCSVEIVRSS